MKRSKKNKGKEKDLLRSIVEATAPVTGADFFRSLVRQLASALEARYAFVAECKNHGRTRVQTLEFWEGEDFAENFEYDVRGTPCEKVLEGTVCYHTENVQALFPEDKDLARLKIESYLGTPLVDRSGEVRGHLAVFDDKPMDQELDEMAILLKIFADRAAAELERKRTEENLVDSQAQLSAVLNTVGEGIITIDSTSTIVMVNQEVEAIWGYLQDELIGEKLQILMPEKYRRRHAAGLKRYLKTRVERVLGEQLELEGLRKDGSSFPLELRIAETRMDDRLLFTAAVRDITERKRAEEQILTNQQMLSDAEQIAHMGSFEWNIPANTLTWSDGLYRIYGLQPQEFEATFEAFLNRVHPDDRERVKRTVEEAYSDAKPFSMEERIVRPDGAVRVLLSKAEVIKDEKGELTRIVGICQDITDQKRAEAALKYRSDFENLITEISTFFINLSPEAIDGGINDALKRIGEFVGADRSYVFLLHDEGTKGSSTHEWCREGISSGMEELQELPAEMFPWFMGFLYRGEAVYIPSIADLPPETHAERDILESQQTQSLICLPMVSRGSLIGFLGVDSVRQARSWSEDVIRLLKIAGEIFANALQHKWDSEALQQANEELEKKVEKRTRELRQKQAQLVQSEKMASLGQLVAGVAHEINTPLGALSSNVDISRRLAERMQNLLSDGDSESLEREELTDPVKRIMELNRINETATKRILAIVDSLRRFARLDEAELDEVDIHEGIENTLTLLQHELKTRIEVRRDYGDIPRINCFPNHLNQAFMNLLVNAVHAIQGPGQILVKTRFRNDSAVIEIRDTGTGIPEENLERIFDPGFTTKQSGVGTGLGLSIVYQIIQDHRGKVEVESRVGQGSTFRLTLPVA